MSAGQNHNILFSQAHLLHKNTSEVIHSCKKWNHEQTWAQSDQNTNWEQPPHYTYSPTDTKINLPFQPHFLKWSNHWPLVASGRRPSTGHVSWSYIPKNDLQILFSGRRVYRNSTYLWTHIVLSNYVFDTLIPDCPHYFLIIFWGGPL